MRILQDSWLHQLRVFRRCNSMTVNTRRMWREFGKYLLPPRRYPPLLPPTTYFSHSLNKIKKIAKNLKSKSLLDLYILPTIVSTNNSGHKRAKKRDFRIFLRNNCFLNGPQNAAPCFHVYFDFCFLSFSFCLFWVKVFSPYNLNMKRKWEHGP